MQVRRQLRADQVTLLGRVVGGAEPSLVGLVNNLAGGAGLSANEARRLKSVIGAELCRAGLGANDEPNKYGIELEQLIDALSAISREV